MKRLLLLPVLALTILASCSSEIEDNTPALQAVMNDSILFKAVDARANFTDDGALLIKGTTNGESISFLMRSTTGPQGFGTCCSNVAAFENIDGRLFSTNPNGTGLTQLRIQDGTVSGTFNLTTYRAGNRDTIVFSQGNIYQVPIVEPITLGDEDTDGPDSVEDSFSARVNTVSFNPTITAAVSAGGNLTLSGQTSSASIQISLPSNTGQGMYDLSSTGAFVATYRAMDMDNVSQSGVLNIISNNTTTKVIIGEFSFETGDFSVTAGRFTLNY